MCRQSRTVARVIASMATRAHGVVSRKELLGAGLSERQVDYRVQTGVLLVEFPGVYRAGHRAPSVEARYMAAVKACGKGAVLSGLAAAYLFGLVKGPRARTGGDGADRAQGQGRQDTHAALGPRRHDGLAPDRGHDRAAHARRPVLIAVVRRAGPRSPRSRCAPPHNAGPGRASAEQDAERQGRRQSAPRPPRRGPRDAERTRAPLPEAAARATTAAAGHQHKGRQPTASTAAGPTTT